MERIISTFPKMIKYPRTSASRPACQKRIVVSPPSTPSGRCILGTYCVARGSWPATLRAGLAWKRHYASSRLAAVSLDMSIGGTRPEEDKAPVETVVLDVSNMKCGGCSAAVKRILMSKPGVIGAAVNLITETAAVQARGPPSVTGEEAAALLTAKGFPAKVRSTVNDLMGIDEAEKKREQEARKSLVNLAVAGGLVLACCTHHAGHLLHAMGYHEYAHALFMEVLGNPVVSGMLGSFALLGPGRQLIIDGFQSLWRGNPNMNSLVGLGCVTSFSVGVISALVPSLGFDASFLEEPVMLLGFVLLGRALEARAKVQAAADLKSLAHLVPSISRLVLDPGTAPGQTASASSSSVEFISVPTVSVREGDILRVLPGERMPVDGAILEGCCAVDESLLTGESALVTKTVGSQVVAGTVNYEGPITIKATATGNHSTLAGIARLVSEAQSREAPVQRLADAIAGKFCYGIMAAAALTFGFWSMLGVHLYPSVLSTVPDLGSPSTAGLLLAINLAVDVLVVACPCAMGLATPTAVLVGSSLGAKKGLLMRGGDVLERIAGVNAVVLDKTGTLTEGKMKLTRILAKADGQSEDDVLKVVAAVESSTRHPLADAVLAEARQRSLQLPEVTQSTTVPGAGVRAVVSGEDVYVGRKSWVLGQLGVSEHDELPRSREGPPLDKYTSVYVGQGGQLLGLLQFKDVLRSDAIETVRELKRKGMRVLLLSGDDVTTVQAVASQAGIAPENAFGNTSPQGKLEVIERLRKEGLKVAMVGDGVNDAPALAAADVGVALKGGLDAAGEAASVVLMGDRLGQVLDCLDLGKATLNKIRQNLAWALVYNLVGIPLAAGALLPSTGIALNPSAAAAMMAFSSVAVVSNSLLLRAQYGLKDSRKERKVTSGKSPDAAGMAAV